MNDRMAPPPLYLCPLCFRSVEQSHPCAMLKGAEVVVVNDQRKNGVKTTP